MSTKIDSNALDYVGWLFTQEGRQARAALRRVDALEAASEQIAEANAAALGAQEQTRAAWRAEEAAYVEEHNARVRKLGEFENRHTALLLEAEELVEQKAQLAADVQACAGFVAKILGADVGKILGFVRARDPEGYATYIAQFSKARAA